MKYKVEFVLRISNEYNSRHIEAYFNEMAEKGYRLHSFVPQTYSALTTGNVAIFEKIDPEAP